MVNQATKRQPRWDKPHLGVPLPKSGTEALGRYLGSFRQINDFQMFVLHMVGHIESTAKHMRELSDSLEKVLPDRTPKPRKDFRGPIEDLKRHRQFFMEVLLVRHVENYLNYLSGLLRVIFVARPEVLRSSEKIDLETVFRHASIEDLVKTVAERKVESLSYSSFGDLADYFSDKFKVELASRDVRDTIIEAIETRNISVHNRCVVSQRYLLRTQRTDITMGDLRAIGIEDLERFAVALTESAVNVDKTARRVLNLKGTRFSDPSDSPPNNSSKPTPLRGAA